MSEMPTVEVDFIVPFSDIDVMEVVWYGNYIRYFEMARCALMQSIEYDWPQMLESGFIWPVVECRLKYVKPLSYGQRIKIRAELSEFEDRLKISYTVRVEGSGEIMTKGHTVQFAISAETGEAQYTSPQVLLEKLNHSDQ
jgi:acyl-CoA thioester hydrolase